MHKVRRAHPTIVMKDHSSGETLIRNPGCGKKPVDLVQKPFPMANARLVTRRPSQLWQVLLAGALFCDRVLYFLFTDSLQFLILRWAKNLLQLRCGFVVDGPQLLHLLHPGE